MKIVGMKSDLDPLYGYMKNFCSSFFFIDS
jgi:hypothetical protein